MEIKATLQKPYEDEQRCNFIVEYNHQQGFEIRETETELQAWGYTGEEEAQKRQEAFEKEFIETSMKDSHGNNAWYRQIPHGYANAPQTIEIVDKYVRDAQGMTEQIASLLIFYEKPDFAEEEECTEEWLIQHQFNPPVNMTLQQWLAFEMDFQIRWADLKYKRQQAQQQ